MFRVPVSSYYLASSAEKLDMTMDVGSNYAQRFRIICSAEDAW